MKSLHNVRTFLLGINQTRPLLRGITLLVYSVHHATSEIDVSCPRLDCGSISLLRHHRSSCSLQDALPTDRLFSLFSHVSLSLHPLSFQLARLSPLNAGLGES
jgi:hypothetical protein